MAKRVRFERHGVSAVEVFAERVDSFIQERREFIAPSHDIFQRLRLKAIAPVTDVAARRIERRVLENAKVLLNGAKRHLERFDKVVCQVFAVF